MKKFVKATVTIIVIVLYCYGCAYQYPLLETGEPAATIKGSEILKILTAVDTNLNIQGIDSEKQYTLLSEDWVYDILTGNPFYGKEPFVKEYVGEGKAAATGKPLHKCWHFAKDTVDFIEERVSNAAFGIVVLQKYREKLFGPFDLARIEGHALCFFVTPDRKIWWINPQMPSEIGLLREFSRIDFRHSKLIIEKS